ncbi:MAG: MOSC domain-containing protein [Verrucomicrobia bacterium]|nr:MOSC domain-containing protein [Verrucomicrobiota bacterium]
MSNRGTITGIFVSAQAGGEPRGVAEIEAAAGHGLVGDRYAEGRGTFSEVPGNGRHLTLIEQEAVEAFNAEFGQSLRPEQLGRNLITSGVRLNDLVGQRVRVGDALILVQRLCEPCTTLQRRLGEDTLRGFVHRGGVRTDVLESGTIRVGDPIRLES